MVAGNPFVGPLADQIDQAGDRLALFDRHLAQDQRLAGHVLQGLDGFPDAAGLRIHLVDEDDVGDAPVVQELQQRTQGQRLLDAGLANDDGDIGDHGRQVGFLGQLNRTRTVDEGPRIAEILDAGDRQFGAHLAGPGFRRSIAYGVAVADRTLAADHTGGRKKALQNCGFSAQIRTHECRTAGCGLVFLRHERLPRKQ